MSKWKTKKQNFRRNAIDKKLHRGRQSGASNKGNYHQQILRDRGYEKIINLMFSIREPK